MPERPTEADGTAAPPADSLSGHRPGLDADEASEGRETLSWEDLDAQDEPPAWQPRFQWFAAQITVVVSGVLIALALNAWWAARQDAARAQAYLHQLSSDLGETERLMRTSDDFLGPTERGIRRLLQSFGEDVPPADSVLHWIDVGLLTDLPHPVLGTAEALVATGDLALIRDDSLRIAIATYLDETRSHLAFYATSSDRLSQDASDLLRVADLSEALSRYPQAQRDAMYATDPTGLIPREGWTAPFPLDVSAFYADRDAYAAVQLMAIWMSNLAGERTRFRETAGALRREVEAAR